MQNGVLVSVIMPAYNCSAYVRKAIDSVLNQTYTNFELLVADDASKDDTKKIIDSYTDARIRRFHNEANQGYLVASNKLLEKAKGEYIIFQDADDYCDPRRIEILMAKLDSDKELYAVGSNVVKVDMQDKEFEVSDFPLKHDDIYFNLSRYRNTLTGSALMFRREILDTIGYYHLYFNRVGWEDYYWYSRIIQKYKVENVPDRLYYYRSNPASVSNRNKSFKSIAGFETIIYYMNRRAEGQEDDIASNNLAKANLMMGRFYISNMLNEKKKLGFKDIAAVADNFMAALKLYLFKLKLQWRNT